MTDPLSYLQTLCRPKLLVRAARIGLCDYNRDRSLRRILPGTPPPAPGHAFYVLLEREEALDAIRLDGSAAYSAARHVEVLAALIHEARLANVRRMAA